MKKPYLSAFTLYRAVVSQESGGDPLVRSKDGAIGLMQIMPATGREIAAELGLPEYDLLHKPTNLLFGTYYLDKMLSYFGGEVELALTAYHSGPGRVSKLLEKTGGSTLADIIDYLGPVGQKYAKQVLARVKTQEV